MSTPSHDPQPSERDPDKLSGTDPLNPAEPGPTQNAGAGLSPEPQKPAADDHQRQSGSPYGYQAAQPSGYAYPGSASMPQAQRPPMPKEVNLAFYLIIAAGVLSLISSVISSGSSGMTGSFAAVGAGFTIAFAIIGTAIYVALAIFIRKGHNWARITATVLAAISVILMIIGWIGLAALQSNPELLEQAAQGQSMPGAFQMILGIVVTLLGVVGVVLCYLKQSNPYFKPVPPQY
ncbi:hypothetical protein GCM10027403_10990 [Arthrobacter tecti]